MPFYAEMLARALALTTLVMLSSSSLAFVPPAFRATARSSGAMRMMAAAAGEKVDVAIVTGGSRGIGKACALELAKYGVKVVVNYASSAESALAVVEEIKALGSEAVAIKVYSGGIWETIETEWQYIVLYSIFPPFLPSLSSRPICPSPPRWMPCSRRPPRPSRTPYPFLSITPASPRTVRVYGFVDLFVHSCLS